MGRARESADRIRSEVPLVRVLYDYGYHVDPDGTDREQQFSCDLHGDGSDSKPSARAYPDSSSFHCFACGHSRDAITLVMEKEGIEFWPAIKKIEAEYGLPSLPWSGESQDSTPSIREEVKSALASNKGLSIDQKFDRIKSKISILYEEGSADDAVCAGYWALYDKVKYYQDSGSHQPQVVSGLLDSLFSRIIEQEKKGQ